MSRLPPVVGRPARHHAGRRQRLPGLRRLAGGHLAFWSWGNAVPQPGNGGTMAYVAHEGLPTGTIHQETPVYIVRKFVRVCDQDARGM